MNKPLFLLQLVMAVMLYACASQPSTYWEKQGATSQDFYIDQAQCNAQAFSIPNANYIQVAIVQNQCLRGKGWYLVEKSSQIQPIKNPMQQLSRMGAAIGESCQIESDCQSGLSCRSKKGGGAECR